jgi:hypothetical protein
MFRKPRLALAAAPMVVALVAVGCGSDNNSNSTSTAAITKAVFVAKSNAICTTGNQAATAAATKEFGNRRPSQAQFASFAAATYVPNIQSQIDQIRALGAPSGDEATVTKILDTAQTDLNKVKSDPALLGGNSAFADFKTVARPYGLTSCASGG